MIKTLSILFDLFKILFKSLNIGCELNRFSMAFIASGLFPDSYKSQASVSPIGGFRFDFRSLMRRFNGYNYFA